MTVTEMAPELAKKHNLPKTQVKQLLLDLQNMMHEKIYFGMEVKIHKVGVITPRVRKPRKFMNMQTGKLQMPEPTYFAYFKQSQVLANRLKTKTVHERI